MCAACPWNHAGDRASGSEWLPPGHAPAAYRLAAELGADYLEPDLVATLDGVLVCRHENEISGTTDVADHPVFADRRSPRSWTGRRHRLVRRGLHLRRAADPAGPRAGPRCVPQHRVRRVGDDPHLRRGGGAGPAGIAASRPADRRTIPEIKYPAYFRRVGLRVEELLTERILTLGLRNDEIMVQSFEPTSLRRLSVMTRVPLVRLVDSEERRTTFCGPATAALRGSDRTGRSARGSRRTLVLAPHKDLVIPRRSDGSLGEPTRLVDRTHRAGLAVQVWTFRAEHRFLPADTDFPPNSPPSPGWASKASSPTTRTRPWQQSARPL